MKRIRYIKFWLLLFFLFGTNVLRAHAAEDSIDPKQIVFLIDESKSMKGEGWQQALDEVSMIAAVLPSDYETALITYNDTVAEVIGFDTFSAEGIETLRKLQPSGYTNTGAALEAALELFSQDALEKRIIIITDGEISMKSQKETQEALDLYNGALKKAESQNIEIDILQLPANFGFGETYLFEELGINRVMLGASNAEDHVTDISLQDIFAEHVKILLISESSIEDIQIFCQSRNIQIAQGRYFAVVDLEHPMEETVSLKYLLAQKGKVDAYLVQEYDLSVEMKVSYETEASEHVIRVHVVNAEGISILTDQDKQEKIGIYIDGSKMPYTVEQGWAVIPYEAEKSGEITVSVDFSGMNSVVFSQGEKAMLYLELPSSEPQTEDTMQYIWIYIMGVLLCLIFVLLLVLLFQSKKKTLWGIPKSPKPLRSR